MYFLPRIEEEKIEEAIFHFNLDLICFASSQNHYLSRGWLLIVLAQPNLPSDQLFEKPTSSFTSNLFSG